MAKERIQKRTSELYKRARRTPPKDPQPIHNMSKADVQKLIHDLNAHQVELEIQNEELCRVQLQLEETRDKYLDLYNLAPIGYFTLDQASRILEANFIGAELLGIKQSELARTRFPSYLSADSQDIFYFHYKEVLNTGAKGSCELKILKADGNFFYAQLLIMAVPEKDKDIQQCKIAVIDLTESRRAEVKLLQSEKKYSTLVEKGNDGVVIIQDGLISFVNSRMTNITGTPPAESIGLPFVDFVSPKYQTFVADNYRKRIKGENAAGRYEIEILTKEGTCIPVEICASAIEYEGKPADMVVIRDITERKRTEEALKASEEKYSTLIEQSSDGVVILKGSLIEFGNRRICELSGYSQEELISKHFDELISSKSNELLLERKRRRLAGEPVPDTYELEIITKDRQKIPVETKIQPIMYKGISARMVIIRDITERKQSEKQLKESEENLRTYLDNAPDGIYLSDLNGHFLYGNKKAEEILGCKKEALIGNSFLKMNLLPAKYLAKAGKLLVLNAMGKNTGPDEFELMKMDKTRIWVEINTAPIKQKDKKIIVGFVRDITERKKSEELVYQERNRAQTYLDIAAVMIVALDAEGKVTLINRRGCEILGYKADEILGKNWCTNFLPERMRDEVLNVWRRINAGEIEPLQQYENQVLTRDGRERTIAWNNVELRDATGRIIGTLSSGEDITAHHHAEKALRESEEKYRLIVENSTDIIFSLNTKGEFVYLSPSVKKVLGYEQSDLLGRTFRSFVHADDVYVIDKAEQSHNVAGGQPTVNDEYRFRDASGEWRWFVSTGVPMREKRGSVFSFVGVARDITEQKQTEAKLKASEQNFRNSMDSSLMGIRIMGDADNTLYANQTMLDMFGYENIEDLRASPPQEHYTAESYAGFVQRKEQFALGESLPDQLEFDIIRKDGAMRHIQLSSKKVLWNDKLQHQFIYHDITDRKNAEQALQASEQNFRNSIDSSSMGIRITGDSEHILYANQALLDMFGYENIEELRASPPQEHYAPESYAGFIQRKEKYARGESIPDQLEIDIIRKDGAMRHLQLSSVKVLWNGKEQRQTLYNDVTERKQAEKRLEIASREWRTTFDSITDLISIHDKDNRIIRVNKAVADLLNTTPQQLVGKYCHEVLRGDQECPANCPHLLAIKTGKPSSIEIFNSKLGVHLQESASPIININGEITGTVLVARDVTQQKRMEEQLILTDRLASIGELSSGIAHELNNPLTSVIGFSQLLMEGDVPANMKEDLGIVHNEAQRAAAIVKNLLTFARKHAPVKELSQVNTVIEDVLRLRAYEQRVNNIEVENRLSPNLPEIMIDHFQMQQVFLNIMVNAEFAMQEAHHKGKLVVTTEKLDGIIRTSFADDGPGITQENLKRLFDPFFTTKEVGKGTGLGLSICHGIVTEHGGQIYATSEKGQGATFVVELPLSG